MRLFNENNQEIFVYVLYDCNEYGCETLVYTYKNISKEDLQKVVKDYKDLLAQWYVDRDAVALKRVNLKTNQEIEENEAERTKIYENMPDYHKLLRERFEIKSFETLGNLSMHLYG